MARIARDEARRRPLLIGEAPTERTAEAGLALLGDTGHRLAAWCGQPRATLDADLVNLYDEPAEKWSARVARSRFRELRSAGLLDYRAVALLGTRVLRASGHVIDQLSWRYESGPATWYLHVPHPSGLNRYWNDKTRLDEVESILRALFGEPEPPRNGELL